MACLTRRLRRTAAHNSKRGSEICLSGVTFVLAAIRLTTHEPFDFTLRYTTAEYARSEASEKPWTSKSQKGPDRSSEVLGFARVSGFRHGS